MQVASFTGALNAYVKAGNRGQQGYGKAEFIAENVEEWDETKPRGKQGQDKIGEFGDALHAQYLTRCDR